LLSLSKEILVQALSTLSKEYIWRLKGFVRLPSTESGECIYILNWAFGRYDLTPFNPSSQEALAGVEIKFVMMGERGEVTKAAKKFAAQVGAELR